MHKHGYASFYDYNSFVFYFLYILDCSVANVAALIVDIILFRHNYIFSTSTLLFLTKLGTCCLSFISQFVIFRLFRLLLILKSNISGIFIFIY